MAGRGLLCGATSASGTDAILPLPTDKAVLETAVITAFLKTALFQALRSFAMAHRSKLTKQSMRIAN